MSEGHLFISYSHKDSDWLDLVQTHFAILRQQGQVTAWSDQDIRPGDHWYDEIRGSMQGADLAVLLVSANFLASDFIMQTELPALLALQSGEKGGRLRGILPLIVEPCLWQHVPGLKELEVRPKGHELSGVTDHQRQADLVDFAQEVARLLYEVPKPREVSPSGDKLPPTILGAKDYATLDVRIAHSAWNNYRIELNFTWSGDRKWDFVHRYPTCMDPDMLSQIDNAEAYAKQLRIALFPDENAWKWAMRAKQHAREKGVPLRLRISIEPSARELHSLNWEKISTCLGSDNPFDLASTIVGRYALGYGASARAALTRRKVEPTALLIGVDPECAMNEAGSSVLTELNAVTQLLSSVGLGCRVNSSWNNLDELARELRDHDGVDYVYLVLRTCNCSVTPQQAIPCSNSAHFGATDRIRRVITETLGALERPPRLVMIAPADAGSPKFGDCGPCFLNLAHEVIEQGVLGVLTLQGVLEQSDWLKFLAPFFGELIQHGQMDRAARAAREQIKTSPHPWAPVLVSRLRSARLWYEPHFMEERSSDATWRLLLSRIAEGRCTPIIGPGIDFRIARFRQRLAMEWADRYQYPLEMRDHVNLPQVAQYISATWGDAQMEQDFNTYVHVYALKRYGHLLGAKEQEYPVEQMLSEIAGKVLLKEPDDPHVVLAGLPFSTYITANFSTFIADALKRSGRQVQEEVFSLESPAPENRPPSSEYPLVYHLFGRLDETESLVLTEDDYFDFLIDFWRERERIPSAVRRALANSSLLFLGFNLQDWDFRVLFRSLLKEQSSQRRRKQLHVAVQVDPDDDRITDPDRAREYLERYFEGFAESDVSIYWGSPEDFLGELQRRWKARGS